MPLLIAIVNNLASILAGIAVLIGLFNRRKLQQVGESVNGKMDALLAVSVKDAKADGVIQGREERG